jgi:hypothetical protein
MDVDEGFVCALYGCPAVFQSEQDLWSHTLDHVRTLKPGERGPWGGSPEPELNKGMLFIGFRTINSKFNVIEVQGDDDNDDDNYSYYNNQMPSPPSSLINTPKQVGAMDFLEESGSVSDARIDQLPTSSPRDVEHLVQLCRNAPKSVPTFLGNRGKEVPLIKSLSQTCVV